MAPARTDRSRPSRSVPSRVQARRNVDHQPTNGNTTTITPSSPSSSSSSTAADATVLRPIGNTVGNQNNSEPQSTQDIEEGNTMGSHASPSALLFRVSTDLAPDTLTLEFTNVEFSLDVVVEGELEVSCGQIFPNFNSSV